MKEKLKEIQNKYCIQIKDYLNSLKEFKTSSILVNFNVDYEFNEYFIITFENKQKIILECTKNPYLRLCNSILYHYKDLKNMDNVLHQLASDQIIYITLIKFAEQYYEESDKCLKNG